MKDTTNEIANGSANGAYRRSLSPGGKLLLQKLRKAATQIETALKDTEFALIKLDAAWAIHRALRESRSVRHEEADEAERSIPRAVNSIDDSMTLLSFAVEDTLKAAAAYPIEGGIFEFYDIFLDQADLVQTIRRGLETNAMPPRTEYQDVLAAARKLLTIISHNVEHACGVR